MRFAFKQTTEALRNLVCIAMGDHGSAHQPNPGVASEGENRPDNTQKTTLDRRNRLVHGLGRLQESI